MSRKVQGFRSLLYHSRIAEKNEYPTLPSTVPTYNRSGGKTKPPVLQVHCYNVYTSIIYIRISIPALQIG